MPNGSPFPSIPIPQASVPSLHQAVTAMRQTINLLTVNTQNATAQTLTKASQIFVKQSDLADLHATVNSTIATASGALADTASSISNLQNQITALQNLLTTMQNQLNAIQGISPATTVPLMDGIATIGVSAFYARADHIHPSDTSLAPLNSPAFVGLPTAPTQPTGDNTNNIATTAFVDAAVTSGSYTLPIATTTVLGGVKSDGSTVTINSSTGVLSAAAPATVAPGMDGTAVVGTSALYARQDHIHPTDTSRYAASNPSGYQTAANVTASLGAYLPLAGGTMTGAVQLAPGAPIHDNRIINGGFDVWQLGTSFSIPVGAIYTADQWVVATNITASNAQKSSMEGFSGVVPSSMNCINIWANSAAINNVWQLVTRFEAIQIGDLDSQICTLSFDLAGVTTAGSLDGWAGFGWNTAVDNGSYSVGSGNVFFSNPTGSVQRVKVQFSAANMAGAKYGGQLIISFQQLTASGNTNIWIGGINLELGPVAQPYVPKGIRREIADCERFLQTSYPLGTAPATASTPSGFVRMTEGATNYACIPCIFRTRIRANPVITLYSPNSGASGVLYNYSSSADVSAAPIYSIITQDGFTACVNNVSLGTGTGIGVHWKADARL